MTKNKNMKKTVSSVFRFITSIIGIVSIIFAWKTMDIVYYILCFVGIAGFTISSITYKRNDE